MNNTTNENSKPLPEEEQNMEAETQQSGDADHAVHQFFEETDRHAEAVTEEDPFFSPLPDIPLDEDESSDETDDGAVVGDPADCAETEEETVYIAERTLSDPSSDTDAVSDDRDAAQHTDGDRPRRAYGKVIGIAAGTVGGVILLTFAVLCIILFRLSGPITVDLDEQISLGALETHPILSALTSADPQPDDIDTSAVGNTQIQLTFFGLIPRTVPVSVCDLTLPAVTAYRMTVGVGDIPDPQDCVLRCDDKTAVTHTFAELPDTTVPGEYIWLLLSQDVRIGLDAELGHQNAGGTADKCGVDADTQTKAVENRHDGQHFHAVDAFVARCGDGLQAQCIEIAVAQPDALGGAGGTAGIENCGAILRIAGIFRQRSTLACRDHIIPEGVSRFGQRMLAALGVGINALQGKRQFLPDFCNQDSCSIFQFCGDGCNLSIKLVKGQNCPGFGEIQVKGDLLGCGQRVDHIGDRTDAVEGIKAVQRLGCIGHTDGDPVTLADSHGRKTPCGGFDALQESGIRSLLAHEHIGSVFRIFQRCFTEHLIHGLLRIHQFCRCVSVKSRPRRVGEKGHMGNPLFLKFDFSFETICKIMIYYISSIV